MALPALNATPHVKLVMEQGFLPVLNANYPCHYLAQNVLSAMIPAAPAMLWILLLA